MKKPAILILDDEILAASYLEELIESVQLKNSFFSNFECITSNTLNDFFDKLKSNLPEIIFLDIDGVLIPVSGAGNNGFNGRNIDNLNEKAIFGNKINDIKNPIEEIKYTKN